MKTEATLIVGGKKLKLSNLDKILYPGVPFTKGQVIDYYVRISEVLLPHLKDHPLTLKRYPNGVTGEFFYEKRCPDFRPPWVKTAGVWSERNHETIHYCLGNNLPTLVWAANLADLELHTSLAKARNPDRPTVMVFDLDPGQGADILDCAQVALWLREELEKSKLTSFPKTSGSKGLQLYVPLNTPVTFERTKEFSHAIADRLTAQHPEHVLARMEKRLRTGKVFIDGSQNDSHKTTVCVYSLRARERPTVSTPVRWTEVMRALDDKDPGRLTFETSAVLERVAKHGDIFEPVLTLKQKLA